MDFSPLCTRHITVLLGLGLITVIGHVRANPPVDLGDLSLEQLGAIEVSVASRIATGKDHQPASVTTISRQQIQFSGARTLNEVLLMYVPGFFLVEDQDDTIAAFRGFSADNNSKTQLLLNGHPLNAEWFWGPPDAVLNGIDFDYIERIEVIRGPGSAALGQGALLGAINIITKPALKTSTRTAGTIGEDNLHQATMESSYVGPDLRTYLYASKGDFEGQALRREGWPKDVFEQGEFIADRGHRLKRSDYSSVFGMLNYHDVEANFIYKQQLRDLYNFFRDREEVQQTLTGLDISYAANMSQQTSVNVRAHIDQDDYDLFSHSGAVMGGTRENRYGFHAHTNINGLWSENRLMVGMEINKYDSGEPNRLGNNFIINRIEDLNRAQDVNADINQTHHYVFPRSVVVQSFFAEDFYNPSQTITLFAGFRLDQHPDWGTQSTPRLGMFYEPNPRWLWRASWQSGFRGAAGVHYSGGFERDGLLREENFNKVEDNATLAGLGFANLSSTHPETLDNYELALKLKPNDDITLDSVLFYNVVRNVIDVGVFYVDPAVADITNEQIGNDRAGTWNGFFYFKNNSGIIKQYGTEMSLKHRLALFDYTLSHAFVAVASADNDQLGGSMYIAGDDKEHLHFKAYPENITRLNLHFQLTPKWQVFYNDVYYWAWWSSRNNKQEGGNIATTGIGWDITQNFHTSFHIKNLFGEDALYPMNNNAGGRDLSDGTPAIESRSCWLKLRYDFN